MREEVSAQRRRELIGEATRSALRLEQQPAYAVDNETGWPARWLNGDRTPPGEWGEGFDEWYSFIRAEVAKGKRIERIRIVEEPPTDYQRWQAWLMQWNTSAGEVIRYLPRSTADQLGISRGSGDWWLFDETLLLEMPFDDEGREHPMILTDEPGQVAQAVRLWAAAIGHCREAVPVA